MTSAAFFDLDRTLISGASVFPFGVEAWRAGLLKNSDIAKYAAGALAFLAFGDKGVKSEGTRAAILGHVDGVSVEMLDEVSAKVLPKLIDRVRPESHKLLQMHHDAGREMWIVSASPYGIVAPLADTLGMTGAIATRGKVIEGHYSAELEGPFVYGAGKADAIARLATERNYDLVASYAYSDSISDLPMLELVGHPVAVNPDSQLENTAHDRGWPVVIFARKTKRAMALGLGTTAAAGALAGTYALGRHHGKLRT
ncbi:MAG: HAD family hydrolase [Acidimicrobiia bacterium]|nr:HAD family hydrolase [Acidimicrobiia bacterium]MDQ3500618.1 HAD-IB family hydrolase [Actinomycetota bacterium]